MLLQNKMLVRVNSLKKMNVGIIGCGWIAEEVHIPNFLCSSSIGKVALADINKERLSLMGKKFGIRELYSDYSELLKDPAIDAVSICVPSFLHAEIGVNAAEARKHILCEKPISTSLSEADLLIHSARKNNVKLMVGHNIRFLPNHELVKKWLAQEKIGYAYFARAQAALQGPYGASGLTSPFYFDPDRGGGVSLDVGVHLADLLLWLFGDVCEVHGSTGTYRTDINRADDVSSISLKFESGVIGELFVSWVGIANYHLMTNFNDLQVIGEYGFIKSDFVGPYVTLFSEKSSVCKLRGPLRMATMDTDPKVPFLAKAYSYKKEIESFISCILKDDPVPITGEEGKRALKLILDSKQR